MMRQDEGEMDNSAHDDVDDADDAACPPLCYAFEFLVMQSCGT